MTRTKRSPDCHPARPHFAKGYCSACYQRAKNGTTSIKRRWTADEDRALALVWGRGGAAVAAEALGRTQDACACRAASLGLSADDGGVSIAALARIGGYSYGRVLRAAADLGVTLCAPPPRRASQVPAGERSEARSWVSPNDQTRILDHLASAPARTYHKRPGGGRTPADAWGTGTKPPHCRRCKRTDRPHRSRGYCVTCAQWARRHGLFDAPPPRVPRVAKRPQRLEVVPYNPAFAGDTPLEVARRIVRPTAQAPDVAATVAAIFSESSRAGSRREWLPAGFLYRKGAA
jgi:hypothetical protein